MKKVHSTAELIFKIFYFINFNIILSSKMSTASNPNKLKSETGSVFGGALNMKGMNASSPTSP